MRRVATIALLVLVAVAAALPLVPGSSAALRAGGVSLVWWYGVVAAPILATLVSLAALLTDVE